MAAWNFDSVKPVVKLMRPEDIPYAVVFPVKILVCRTVEKMIHS